jgi:phosphoserine phosphatase
MIQPLRIIISMDDQKLQVIRDGQCIAVFDISTAEKGMGFAEGSHRTPTGRFRICEKIGDSEPSGTIFRGRKPCGIWHAGDDSMEDLVLTRILRLDGLDPHNRNTLDRFIYIHGTNDEARIGSRAGHGCVRLRNEEMIRLYDMVNVDDSVEILPATKKCGKLAFIGFDSVLVATHGIDQLARQRGAGAADACAAIMNQMNHGELDACTAYRSWMELIRPDEGMLERAANSCLDAVAPDAPSLTKTLEAAGFLPVLLSRSPMELARPVATTLGIRHIEAPVFNPQSCDWSYPFINSLFKYDVVNDWAAAMLPGHLMVIGSGVDDMSARCAADTLVAVGPAYSGCDHHLLSLNDVLSILNDPCQLDNTRENI